MYLPAGTIASAIWFTPTMSAGCSSATDRTAMSILHGDTMLGEARTRRQRGLQGDRPHGICVRLRGERRQSAQRPHPCRPHDLVELALVLGKARAVGHGVP